MSTSAPLLSLCRHASFCALLVWGLVASQPALAQTEIANDGFDTNQQGTIATAALIPNEMYAASFTIPANFLPAELLGVRVVMIDGDNPQQNYCGRFTLEVWNDDLSTAPTLSPNCPILSQRPLPVPTTSVYSMSTQFSDSIGFQIRGDRNNYQDLLFSSINNNPQLMVTIPPIILTQPEVRVGLKALDLQCGAMSADAFPLMLTDLDGEAIAGTNYLYGYFDGVCPAVYEFLLWRDMAQFLSSQPGDFVMRLLLRAQGGVDTDMGNMMMDMMMDMMMPDMPLDMMEEDMFVVVDMTPDGAMIDMHMFEDMAAAQDMMQVGQDMEASTDQGALVTLALTNISPSSVKQGTGGDVVLLGSGFEVGAEVRLNARQIGVLETKSGNILATLPSDLDAGRYDVIVTNPDGGSAILTMGFEVTGTEIPDMDSMVVDQGSATPDAGSGMSADVESPDGDGCGCQSTGVPAQRHGSMLLLLGGAVLLGWRRRRA